MIDLSNSFYPYEKKYSTPKEKKTISKKREPSGELTLFRQIYEQRKGLCQVTWQRVDFHPTSFLHVLSKGAYPRFRLYKKNIVMTLPDIHHLYDNGSKEYLLSIYPKAIFIYDLKDELKTEYYE